MDHDEWKSEREMEDMVALDEWEKLKVSLER